MDPASSSAPSSSSSSPPSPSSSSSPSALPPLLSLAPAKTMEPVPLSVEPPSPPAEDDADQTSSTTQLSIDPIPTRIPWQPIHRSMSGPLSDRMGTLRHPRPLIPSSHSPDIAATPQTAQASGMPSSDLPSSPHHALAAHLPPRRRPLRAYTLSSTSPTSAGSETNSSALAHLILDTIQLPISHLLHVIPPHLLDASHETLSATSVAVPVTTIEALLEAFRSINWICNAYAENGLAADSANASAKAYTPTSTAASSQDAPLSELKIPGAFSDAYTKEAEPTARAESPVDLTAAASSAVPAAPSKSSFDLCELAQRAADVVSGQAADKGIDVVLCWHGLMSDEGLLAGLQTLAFGDEGAVRYALIHALSRLLDFMPPQSTLQLALAFPSAGNGKGKVKQGNFPCAFELRLQLSSHDADARELLLFRPEDEVLSLAKAHWHVLEGPTPDNSAMVQLSFSDLQINPSEIESQMASAPESADSYERQRFLPHLSLAEEPTPRQLATFASFDLQDKTVALHAHEHGAFASSLAKLLQMCGCRVARVPLSTVTSNTEHPLGSLRRQHSQHLPTTRTAVALSQGRPGFVRYSTEYSTELANKSAQSTTSVAADAHPVTAILDPVSGVPVTLPADAPSDTAERDDSSPAAGADMLRQSSTDTIKADGDASGSGGPASAMDPFSFLMIDDDLDTLQQELLRLRSALPLLQGALGQTTPYRDHGSAASHDGFPLHSGASRETSTPSAGNARITHAIIFFTSLRNFRSVRDTVRPILESSLQGLAAGSARFLPEIIVVPKPAGSRRILAALHTAVFRPVVDPFFAPIATSPMSPLLWEVSMQLSGREQSLTPMTPSAPRSGHRTASATPATAPGTPARDSSGHFSSPATPSVPTSASRLRPEDAVHRSYDGAIGGTPGSSRGARAGTTQLSPSGASSATSQRSAAATKPPKSPNLRPLHIPLPPATPSIRSSQGSSSPMHVEALGYFSETAARMGGSAASGLVVQSPDGRPAGIFFHPKNHGGHSAKGSSGRKTSSGHLSSRGSDASGASSRKRGSDREVRASTDNQPPRSIASVFEQVRNSPSLGHASSNGAGESAGTDPEGEDAPRRPIASLRRDSNSSSTTTRATSFGDAAPGTLFSPQVGIEHVLSSGRLPVTVPVITGGDRQNASGSTQGEPTFPGNFSRSPSQQGDSDAKMPGASHVDSSSPSTEKGTKDETERDVGSHGEIAGDDTPAPRKPPQASSLPPTAGKQQGPKIDHAMPEHAERRQGAGAAAEVEGNHAGTGIDGDKDARHANSAFTTMAPHARPSAQPQSGLLIGAGFAPTAKRGGGPRRPQVREKVLPPIKVLIVEDNPINQRILKQFMTRKKINFETAVNGREAVDKWATGGFHLILMDIQLPVMDGIEATKEIRKQEMSANVGVLPATPPVTAGGMPKVVGPEGQSYISTTASGPAGTGTSTSAAGSGSSASNAGPETPFRASVIIVALTASVLNSDRVAALAAGCNDFLNKPVSLPWLEKKIIEWGSMQYILLSGAGVFDAERRAQRLLGAGRGGIRGEQGALMAAANNSDLRRAFGKAPDANARALASKLHLPPKKSGMGLSASVGQKTELRAGKDARQPPAASTLAAGVPESVAAAVAEADQRLAESAPVGPPAANGSVAPSTEHEPDSSSQEPAADLPAPAAPLAPASSGIDEAPQQGDDDAKVAASEEPSAADGAADAGADANAGDAEASAA